MNPQKEYKSQIYLVVAFIIILTGLLSFQYARVEAIMDGLLLDVPEHDLELVSELHGKNYVLMTATAFQIIMSGPTHFNGFSVYKGYIIVPFLVLNTFTFYTLFMLYLRRKLTKQTMDPTKTDGSAKWGDPVKFAKHERTKFSKQEEASGKPNPNRIIAHGVEMSILGQGINHKDERNANDLIIGGSGSGKVRLVGMY